MSQKRAGLLEAPSTPISIRRWRLFGAAALALIAFQSPAEVPSRVARRSGTSLPRSDAPKAERSYGVLPLAFEPNVGQTDSRVRFLARGGGMTMFFTDAEAVMVLTRGRAGKKPVDAEKVAVRMKLLGSETATRQVGLDPLPGVSNYFIGNDPAKWRTDVPHYGRIRYTDVYPGIDLVWYGSERRLEYDFVVAPGADPSRIQTAYEGAESLRVDANGDLVLKTALGDLRQQRPRVFQEVGGRQVEVAARYRIGTGNRVEFAVSAYDRRTVLRIDPVVLLYSTYLGGSGYDLGNAIAVDGAGSAYVTGNTQSANFPVQSEEGCRLAMGS
jgi:hypothetical protein